MVNEDLTALIVFITRLWNKGEEVFVRAGLKTSSDLNTSFKTNAGEGVVVGAAVVVVGAAVVILLAAVVIFLAAFVVVLADVYVVLAAVVVVLTAVGVVGTGVVVFFAFPVVVGAAVDGEGSTEKQ